jgi:hypothetical protein
MHKILDSIFMQVALKLVPESKTFIDLLKTEDEDCDTLKQKMQILVSLLVPFLEDIHCILVSSILLPNNIINWSS